MITCEGDIILAVVHGRDDFTDEDFDKLINRAKDICCSSIVFCDNSKKGQYATVTCEKRFIEEIERSNKGFFYIYVYNKEEDRIRNMQEIIEILDEHCIENYSLILSTTDNDELKIV